MKPHRRRTPRPAPLASHAPYVYKADIGADERKSDPNIACAGNSVRFKAVVLEMPVSRAMSELANRSFASEATFYGRHVTITVGPAGTITMPWSTPVEQREAQQNGGYIPNAHDYTATTTASRVCAATVPDAALGTVGRGVLTWTLPQPVTSVAALLARPATNADLEMSTLAFAIQPDGSVPAFTP